MQNFYNYINEIELPYYIKFIASRINEKLLLNIKKNIPQILIVSMPPRSLKTTLSMKLFSNWVIEQFNNKKISILSYSTEIVKLNIKYNINKNIKNRIYNAHSYFSGLDEIIRGWRGGELTVWTGQSGSGKSTNIKTDILIVDDYFKNLEDRNFLDEIYEQFSDIVYYNLTDNPFILIMATRFCKNDIIGKILNTLSINDKNFMIDYINIEAIATENDILNREIGESFWKEKYSKNLLLKIKNNIGEKYFKSMYQGNPIT